jgi:hypothetical protein
VLFAFVGIQMGWNLQPFVGDRGRPFQLFRHNEGNFYTAVVYSVGRIMHGDEKAAPPVASPMWRPGVGIMPDLRAPSAPDSGRARSR